MSRATGNKPIRIWPNTRFYADANAQIGNASVDPKNPVKHGSITDDRLAVITPSAFQRTGFDAVDNFSDYVRGSLEFVLPNADESLPEPLWISATWQLQKATNWFVRSKEGNLFIPPETSITLVSQQEVRVEATGFDWLKEQARLKAPTYESRPVVKRYDGPLLLFRDVTNRAMAKNASLDYDSLVDRMRMANGFPMIIVGSATRIDEIRYGGATPEQQTASKTSQTNLANYIGLNSNTTARRFLWEPSVEKIERLLRFHDLPFLANFPAGAAFQLGIGFHDQAFGAHLAPEKHRVAQETFFRFLADYYPDASFSVTFSGKGAPTVVRGSDLTSDKFSGPAKTQLANALYEALLLDLERYVDDIAEFYSATPPAGELSSVRWAEIASDVTPDGKISSRERERFDQLQSRFGTLSAAKSKDQSLLIDASVVQRLLDLRLDWNIEFNLSDSAFRTLPMAASIAVAKDYDDYTRGLIESALSVTAGLLANPKQYGLATFTMSFEQERYSPERIQKQLNKASHNYAFDLTDRLTNLYRHASSGNKCTTVAQLWTRAHGNGYYFPYIGRTGLPEDIKWSPEYHYIKEHFLDLSSAVRYDRARINFSDKLRIDGKLPREWYREFLRDLGMHDSIGLQALLSPGKGNIRIDSLLFTKSAEEPLSMSGESRKHYFGVLINRLFPPSRQTAPFQFELDAEILGELSSAPQPTLAQWKNEDTRVAFIELIRSFLPRTTISFPDKRMASEFGEFLREILQRQKSEKNGNPSRELLVEINGNPTFDFSRFMASHMIDPKTGKLDLDWFQTIMRYLTGTVRARHGTKGFQAPTIRFGFDEERSGSIQASDPMCLLPDALRSQPEMTLPKLGLRCPNLTRMDLVVLATRVADARSKKNEIIVTLTHESLDVKKLVAQKLPLTLLITSSSRGDTFLIGGTGITAPEDYARHTQVLFFVGHQAMIGEQLGVPGDSRGNGNAWRFRSLKDFFTEVEEKNEFGKYSLDSILALPADDERVIQIAKAFNQATNAPGFLFVENGTPERPQASKPRTAPVSSASILNLFKSSSN